METPCTQLPPSTPPQVGPAGWTSALGPMNSRSAGTLAVRRVKFFGQHRGEVNSSAFSPDGQRLLTASEDGYVYGWETQSGRLLWRLGGHTGPIKFCRFSPDGHLFATTSGDCTIRLWDVAEAKCLHVLKGHQRSVETATGSWDSAICIWDLRTGTPVISHQELEGHSGNISCLCYSASGLLASGSWDKTIHIWKPSTRNLLVHLKGHVTWVKSIAFSPDGSQLASAGYSHMVKVWDCNTGKCIETLKGVLDVAHACAFTPDGKLLVSGAADQGAWDPAERAPERTVRAAARHRPKVTLTEHPTDPCDQDWSRSHAGAANSRRQACQSPQAPSNHDQGTPAHLSSTVR
ncbi:WD repeat-containing protein 38 isoform X3 [Panthera tigris]|uniref:WD repeat-containing protein 38 isoform X3 n=1 Tax=Panthera tigris TaxID=9694 RepID=UPI001C6FC4AE|nr:WD repeat-containing protein 38 isoform X3 [Panthera tigris]